MGTPKSKTPEVKREYRRRWRARHPKRRRESDRRGHLKRYGLTPEDYEALLIEQEEVCAVCKKKPGKQRLAVDHDHETGKARGLLCLACNSALGMAEDSVERLLALVHYLQRHF